MVEKLKWLEEMTAFELHDLQEALIAYSAGLSSEDITSDEKMAVQIALMFYYDADYITSFVHPEVMEVYESRIEKQLDFS